MSDAARVTSVDALWEFRTALVEFAETIKLALGEAQSEVQRTAGWLDGDCAMHWRTQLRQRNARLSDAKSELMRAEIASREGRASAVLERKNVRKWTEAVEEAEAKLRAINRWRRDLEQEITKFRGQCQPLGRQMENDVPKAMARLQRYATALEKYAKMAPPSAGDYVVPASVFEAADEEGGADAESDSA